jgi:hypothetical protein
MGSSLHPAHPAGYERTLAMVRAAMGDEAFAIAHASGQQQSLDDVLAETTICGSAEAA